VEGRFTLSKIIALTVSFIHMQRVTSSLRSFLFILLACGAACGATISPGGLAVIGYRDNGEATSSPDGFVLLATESIAAGTVVYATNNGWTNAAYGQFAGSGTSFGAGAGAEQLVQLTFNTTVTAGTTISSFDTGNAAFSWTTSGSIPGIGGSTFAPLQFKHPNQPGGTFASSDQIYLFQGSASNPLLNVQNFIYQLDFGDIDNPGFEDYLGTDDEGALPDGNVSTDGGNSYYTVTTLQQGDDGDPLTTNDYTAVELLPVSNLHEGTFGINLSNPTVASLQSNGGTKAQWLMALSQTVNWAPVASLPSGGFNILGIPEPSRVLTLGLGLLLGTSVRRRPRQ
jgi:uncharacterized protein